MAASSWIGPSGICSATNVAASFGSVLDSTNAMRLNKASRCSPGGLAAARIALAWLDATANAALPPSLADVLVRSVDEVEHARSQAAACVDLERQIRERAQRLGEHVGLTGLQLEDYGSKYLLSTLAHAMNSGLPI